MASKGQMTGMLGAYLAAAKLTQKGLVVSVTSRNARGADLLVTDQEYKKTWSVQVKTNRKPATFRLLSKDYKELGRVLINRPVVMSAFEQTGHRAYIAE
jgi:hypothetical protein